MTLTSPRVTRCILGKLHKTKLRRKAHLPTMEFSPPLKHSKKRLHSQNAMMNITLSILLLLAILSMTAHAFAPATTRPFLSRAVASKSPSTIFMSEGLVQETAEGTSTLPYWMYCHFIASSRGSLKYGCVVRSHVFAPVSVVPALIAGHALPLIALFCFWNRHEGTNSGPRRQPPGPSVHER